MADTVSLVADLNPGPGSSYPSDFIPFNNRLFFGADSDASSHDELWALDGTGPRIADPTRDYFQIEGPAVLDGRLYFTAANDDDDGWELWRYDGGRSTRLLGAADGFHIFTPGVFASGGSLLFWASGGEQGLGLWKYDTAGATLLSPLLYAQDRSDYDPYGFTVFNGSVYFRAREQLEAGGASTLNELWRYDGRSVARAPGIEPGSLTLSEGMAVLGASLYFPARGAAYSDTELWKYDGASASLAADVLPGPEGSEPSSLEVLGGSLYFCAHAIPTGDAFAGEVWRYDPAAGAASRVSESFGNKPSYLAALGGTLYFRAGTDRFQPDTLWSYDGAAVAKAGNLTLNFPGGFTQFQDALYFAADDGAHGFEPWKILDDNPPPPPPAAQVVARRVFYNHSAFDGSSPAADARDDAAVAPDKQALLPGRRASFANYTSYSRGLNGIMIDVRGLPAGGGLDLSDFTFKAGNSTNPGAWSNAPAPAALTVRRGAGGGGADRVTLVWADGSVRNRWLRVTVKANADTGLASADVFYFGNIVGETGDLARLVADVTFVDVLRTAANVRGTRVGIDSRYDFDRNRVVTGLDVALAKRSLPTPPLRLFTAPRTTSAASTLLAKDEDDAPPPLL